MELNREKLKLKYDLIMRTYCELRFHLLFAPIPIGGHKR
jgi:hypothetical protein